MGEGIPSNSLEQSLQFYLLPSFRFLEKEFLFLFLRKVTLDSTAPSNSYHLSLFLYPPEIIVLLSVCAKISRKKFLQFIFII